MGYILRTKREKIPYLPGGVQCAYSASSEGSGGKFFSAVQGDLLWVPGGCEWQYGVLDFDRKAAQAGAKFLDFVGFFGFQKGGFPHRGDFEKMIFPTGNKAGEQFANPGIKKGC